MKNKYQVWIDSDGWCEGHLFLDLYNDITKQSVGNKEEWKAAMRTDYILDELWNLYVEDKHKE